MILNMRDVPHTVRAGINGQDSVPIPQTQTQTEVVAIAAITTGKSNPPGDDSRALATITSKGGKTKTVSSKKSKSPSIRGPTWENYYNRHVQLLVSLAFFSYLGQCLRYAIEIVFGRACHEPETIGWDLTLGGRWKACTGDPGTTESTGGAFFSDLPTNVIGCFLMGLLVSGDGESIAVNLPVAALGRTNSFQAWVVTHVGLRTGFCGALTTFASWNTQIVKMACGRRGTALGYSQWMSALWGYIIGIYGALQSYQFGVAIAFALSRRFNPQLAREADAIMDKKAIEPLARYGTSGYESFYNDHVHHLLAWKTTTDSHRNAWPRSGKRCTAELHEIERNLLVYRIEPREELLTVARDAGWDVDALRCWTEALDEEEAKRSTKNHNNNSNSSNSKNSTALDDNINDGDFDSETHIQDDWHVSSHHSSLLEAALNLMCYMLLTGLLVRGFVRYGGRTDAVARSYRTQCLSALLSPLGTYTRWYLSRLNGSIRHKDWEWFPIGTFVANMFASVVSAGMAALLLVWDSPDASELTVIVATAIQVGYAGSCSTVSTFATETVGLLRALPRAFWGYYYAFGTFVQESVLLFDLFLHGSGGLPACIEAFTYFIKRYIELAVILKLGQAPSIIFRQWGSGILAAAIVVHLMSFSIDASEFLVLIVQSFRDASSLILYLA
eukprot:jgi/Psemu1/287390/fgenesh1_pg.189_\